MIGGAALDALGCRLVLDLHDNLPLRQSLTRSTVRRALRERIWPLLRGLRPEEVADALLPDRLEGALSQEVALLRRFDDVLFASAAERHAYVAAGLDPTRARDWRWGFDLEAGPITTGSAQGGFDIGFIGGANAFNLEALAFLAREVLPRLEWRLRRAPSVLLGGGGAAAMRALFADRPAAVIEPWVDSLRDFYRRAAVIAVPLRAGTGVSIKTIEAALAGAAIVTTSAGARGLALAPGKEFELADDADGFADALALLLRDPSRRAALGGRARAAAEARHSMAAFTAQAGALLGAGRSNGMRSGGAVLDDPPGPESACAAMKRAFDSNAAGR